MINLFPRRFISLLLMAFVLIVAVLPFLGISSIADRVGAIPPVVPDACLNEAGNPVIPRVPVQGAKALVLNFNHAPSPFQTEACLATLYPIVDPEEYDGVIVNDVGYEIVYCPIVGNVGLLDVGDDLARFDGNFHIECDSDLLRPEVTINKFYVYAKALFHNTGPKYYKLASHPNFEVRANVDNNWHVKLSSRYGSNALYFAHKDTTTNVQNTVARLYSQLRGTYGSEDADGSHVINGKLMPPPADIGPFDLDDTAPIVIGQSSAGHAWDMDIIIIDPPNSYH